ncbi:N-acetylmuramoyl-L-alanine amidase [Candidatus Babeliales bacterium]|nr:N-acetylmuramoyl-L-alanine amidase [Candidatus Babeliales bacterium]
MHITRFLIFNFIFFTFLYSDNPLVMLSPAGDAKNPGRTLDKGYERGVTLQIAEKLKEKIIDIYGARCLLTRSPGEVVSHLQNASFANRIFSNRVGFYLSIHVYHEEDIKPKLAIYRLVYNSMVDFASHNFSKFSFLTLYEAHFINIYKTKSFAEKMAEILTNEEHGQKFDFYGINGIPFKPLLGIIVPALAIEIGIKEEEQWRGLINPIVESMKFLLSF